MASRGHNSTPQESSTHQLQNPTSTAKSSLQHYRKQILKDVSEEKVIPSGTAGYFTLCHIHPDLLRTSKRTQSHLPPPSPITFQRLCADGGPSNIRSHNLKCLRYAIEAGAMGLQILWSRKRSVSDLANLFREYQPFGYMFSEPHFRFAKDAQADVVIYA
ncbi:hypothetical protein F5Y19DRAFT_486563 [Xylariaceae sp. FL1651]|nr:hypothetical protein F5Y19DRAFT_486563 [Xylariaceae sp. FL1651]